MNANMIHIGFGNILAMDRVIAITPPSSAPIKRTIQEAKEQGLLIDATNGRRTKAVIFADTGHVILAAIAPETVVGRYQNLGGPQLKAGEEDEDIQP